MPLQQLVEYFNDRLEWEHNSNLRPFLLQDDRVYGVLGSEVIGSDMSPIRETLRYSKIVGYAAKIKSIDNACLKHTLNQSNGIYDESMDENGHADSIINFDRLTRTVHMLNYLPQSHLDDLLVLDVDPRHILGVKTDHGAYFEEIIIKCGLQTHHVAIALKVGYEYSRVYPALLKGLYNYQKRGYKIALKFDYYNLDKSTLDLISRAGADLVGMSAVNLDGIRDNRLPEKLRQLCHLVTAMDSRSLMLDINDKRTAEFARQMGFNFVQGAYFEQHKPVHNASGFSYAKTSRNHHQYSVSQGV